MTSKKVMSRAVVALALGTALAMSTAALAGAQGHGWGRLSSPRVSPFSFANDGTGGDVTAVSTSSITITEWNGTSATFALTGTTTYSEGKTSVTWSALATGERVNIGVSSSDPTTATSVNIELAELFGTVQSVTWQHDSDHRPPGLHSNDPRRNGDDLPGWNARDHRRGYEDLRPRHGGHERHHTGRRQH